MQPHPWGRGTLYAPATEVVTSEMIALYDSADLVLQDNTPSFVVPIEAWLRKIFAGTQETIDKVSIQ